jgi:hypothetical protein
MALPRSRWSAWFRAKASSEVVRMQGHVKVQFGAPLRPTINGRAEIATPLKGPVARFSGLVFSAGGFSPWRGRVRRRL